MKTKEEKNKELKTCQELLETSQVMVFVEFSKIPAEEFNLFKSNLKKKGAKFKVIKKRLLNILLKNKQIDFDTRQATKEQLGTIFAKDDFLPAVNLSYEFIQGKKGCKILGGYDIKGSKSFDSELFNLMALSPSKEALISRFLGTLLNPIRSFLYLLKTRSNIQK